MSTAIRVNGDKVRAAMNRQHLSDRQVNTQSRIGQQVARTVVLDSVIHGSTPLVKVRAYLDTLGLTWGELFDEPQADAPTDCLPLSDRRRTLARIVTTADRGIDIDSLSVVLGVTLNELRDDLDSLRPALAALGFNLVVGENMRVTLRRGHDPAYDEAVARLERLRDARDDLNISAANTLYRAYKGTLSTRELGNNDQVQVGALTARGALDPPRSNNRTPLSADTLYCLEPTTTT